MEAVEPQPSYSGAHLYPGGQDVRGGAGQACGEAGGMGGGTGYLATMHPHHHLAASSSGAT